MIQTTTPLPELPAALTTPKAESDNAGGLAGPSKKTLMNILSYSKNLEVKRSSIVGAIGYLRS